MFSNLLPWRSGRGSKSSGSQVYLVKDSNDLISWCQCPEALASFPGQLDCPWCGCGWLFTCIACRKAFTFARAVQVDRSLEELGTSDLQGRWGKAEPDSVVEWVGAMTELLDGLEVGKRYVYLDGHFLAETDFPFAGTGWHSRHAFERAPQVDALSDRGVIDRLLANPEYWMLNRLVSAQ
jgi:hypothetical protein